MNTSEEKIDSTSGAKVVEKTQAEEIADAAREERNTMPYNSASSCTPLGVSVPTKLAYETVEALNSFAGKGIDTTEYVREKLGYSSRIPVCNAFGAEQVDSIALAIKQIERSKGFILGDMAGIGKGRVCAAIVRYAIHQGKIPVFVTVKSSLFSDIYRDFASIGGVGPSGKIPTPFIFNSDADSIIKKVENQEDGTEIIKKLYAPLPTGQTLKICKEGKMPKGADVLLVTYSQLQADIEGASGKNVKIKYDFLKLISPNCIFVFDESHRASGNGVGAENWADILKTSFGVMFSSATFAKTPSSMLLYITKTDIADSNINPDTIVNAVKENGEAVQEYVASALVKSGQMIRRERTYEKCKITYDYIKKDVDKYYATYDTITKIYNKIEDYCKSEIYKKAFQNARARIAEENKIVIVAEDDKKPPITSEAYYAWYEKNKLNYIMSYDTTRAVRNRFPFIESLLFSIKADFVVENVLNALSKKTILNPDTGKEEPAMYEYKIGKDVKMVNTNTKPVIAVRSTNQSMLENLGYKVGQILSEEEFDFARCLTTIAQNILVGKCSLTPVEEEKGVREKIEIEEARITEADFTDYGSSYLDLLVSVKMGKSGLPLSPLDYVKEKIQAATRQSWDYDYAAKPNYAVEEVTGRSMGVRKIANGYEVYQIKYEKTNSTIDKVARFNSGESDVIILNTSGATGLSLHSEIGFKDRRPRNMFMFQVQLDIAIEVQMRGRVNRTGQINNPSYTYLVSCVPSEVRKLLMLRQKLRSLDANTTGNVRQSAKSSQVVDRKGFEVEDMTNHYGWELLKEYVKTAGVLHDGVFKLIYQDLKASAFWKADDKAEQRFSDFLLEIEKLMCLEQEKFYDDMNELYVSLKKEKVANQEWDLETSVEDLNASIENKKYLYIGNDENQFTKSVFIEDKFVNPKGKPMKSRAEVTARMVRLADGEDNFTKRQNDLLAEFAEYKKEELAELMLSLGTPDTEGKTKEQIAKIMLAFKERKDTAILNQKYKFDQVESRLKQYKIGNYYMIPNDPTTLFYTPPFDKDGKRIPLEKSPAIFLGFKVPTKKEVAHRFNPMAVELQFASPRRVIPYYATTCTIMNKSVLDWIAGAIDEKERQKLGLAEEFVNATSMDISDLDSWRVVKSSGRQIMRVLTGEIFKAIELSDSLIVDRKDQYSDRKKLIKYSTTAGTVETGVRMFSKYFSFKPLTDSITPVYVPINSDEFIKFIKTKNVVWFQSFKDAVIYNKFNDKYELYICTGKPKGKKVEKNYVSALSKPEVVAEIENIVHTGKKLHEWTVEMYATGSSKLVHSMEFYKFEMNEETFKNVLDFIYKDYSFKQEIESKEDYVLRDLEDMAKSEHEKYKKGEYEYFPTQPFLEENPPANYIRNSFASTPDNPYGIIKLYYPLMPFDASVVGYIPAKLTESKGIRNILDSLEEGKVKTGYISAVKEMAKGLGEDPAENKIIYKEIATFTEDKIMFDPIYAIGKVLPSRIGRIIVENIDNPSPSEEEEKIVEAEEDEKEILPLNFDTAQDYMIKFKSL